MTYTYSEARQKLASLLEKAKRKEKVLIKKRDGSIFEIKPVSKNKSPLDIKGVNLKISREEILTILKEVRSR